MNGNKRFVAGQLKPQTVVKIRESLTKPQHSQAMVLSCSDRGVPPELVVDQTLRDLFVVRTAGAHMKKCDIVMKGGITSGIVYPGAVCKLAEKYEFQSIGGTASAGAIAAALYRRRRVNAPRRGAQCVPRVGEGAQPSSVPMPPSPTSGSNPIQSLPATVRHEGSISFRHCVLLKGIIPITRAVLWVLWLEFFLGLAFGAALIYFGWQNTGLKGWGDG